LVYLYFPEKIDFEDFLKFLKIQKNIVDLCLDFGINDMTRNDYSEFLLHLVNLKTLEKLELGYNEKYVELIKKGKIYNESVKHLQMGYIDDYQPFDYQPYARCFPNLTSLDLYFAEDVDVADIDISSIKSLKNLKKLKVAELGNKIIEKIEFKQVRELNIFGGITSEDRIEKIFYKLDADDVVFNMDDFDMETDALTMHWKNFAEKNQQLESLELCISILHLHILLEKLPKLKTLKIPHISLFESTYKATVDLIGKCYDRLEHFEMRITANYRDHIETMFKEYLKESYPSIQFTRNKYHFYIFSK
jgi:hypothetical protein